MLGDAALPVAAVLDPKHLQAALEALSTAVAGAEYEHQKKRYKAAWAYLDALEGKDSAEEERLPRLCPACLHDGVLERTLGRAEAAEGKLAAITVRLPQHPEPDSEPDPGHHRHRGGEPWLTSRGSTSTRRS